jgi:ferric hydroxamate transport system substrate-binding protein
VALAPGRSRAEAAPRVASLDYGLAQTLIALDHPPVALAAAAEWNRYVVEPALPSSVVNLGTEREVNFEILAQLAPDLIVSTPYLERLRPTLERIGPVASFPIHAAGSSPWANLVAATRGLGARLGLGPRAEEFVTATEAGLRSGAATLAAWRDRPVLLVLFLDARNVWVFGRNSLYDDVIARLGLVNGWRGPTNVWGFATVGMEALARVPDARLVCFDPVPPEAARLLADSPIWRATGFARPDRMIRLPPVLAFGALPVATRLARLLAEAARRG